MEKSNFITSWQEVHTIVDDAMSKGNRSVSIYISPDGGDDPMGMTDNQYKGMLLDQLEDWQEVLDLAIKAGNTEIQEKVEKQIRKINEKLKF